MEGKRNTETVTHVLELQSLQLTTDCEVTSCSQIHFTSDTDPCNQTLKPAAFQLVSVLFCWTIYDCGCVKGEAADPLVRTSRRSELLKGKACADARFYNQILVSSLSYETPVISERHYG